MDKKYLTNEKYVEFLDVVEYCTSKSLQTENRKNLNNFSPKRFCEEQIIKFDIKDGDKSGCSLNFALYLLKKYKGYLLSCKDGDDVHYAFIYPHKNSKKLYVCDPEKEKIFSNMFGGKIQNLFFDVPLASFEFSNVVNDKIVAQQYDIHMDIDTDDMYGTIENKLLNGEKISVAELEDVDEEELIERLNAAQMGGN